MIMRPIPAVGATATVKYIPMPYLGTGVVEAVEVTGTVKGYREFKGVNYIALTLEDGTVFERNLNEIEEIVGTVAPAMVATEAPRRAYNRA